MIKLSRTLQDASTMFNLNVTEVSELSRILSRLIQGSLDSPNISNPILEHLGEAKVLDGWDEVFNGRKSEINETLHSIEESERAKFGSRSKAKPWCDIKQDFYDYWSNQNPDSNLKQLEIPSNSRLRPWDVKRVISTIKSDTNSGLPYLTKKGKVKDKFLDEAFLESEWLKEYAAVPFVRTQEMQIGRAHV